MTSSLDHSPAGTKLIDVSSLTPQHQQLHRQTLNGNSFCKAEKTTSFEVKMKSSQRCSIRFHARKCLRICLHPEMSESEKLERKGVL
eukprot:2672754-Amphidinium_carterae.1